MQMLTLVLDPWKQGWISDKSHVVYIPNRLFSG